MDQIQSLKPLVAIGVVILGAIFTWTGTIAFHLWKERSEQRRKLLILFGELRNIEAHYNFARKELPRAINTRFELLRIKMAEYGPVSYSGKSLSELGILDANSIINLMQLALRIRNTDYCIKLIFDQKNPSDAFPKYDDEDRKILEWRMTYVIDVTKNVLDDLKSRHSKLKALSSDQTISVERPIPPTKN